MEQNIISEYPKKNGIIHNSKNGRLKSRDKLLFYILMAAIPMLQWLLFYVVVNFNSLLLAFKEYTLVDGKTTFVYVGFKNFSFFFDDLFFGTKLVYAVKNSITAFSVSLIIGIPLTLMFSYYIFKEYFISGMFKFVLLLPSMVSAIVLIIMFKGFVSDAIPALMEKITGEKTADLLNTASTRFATVLFYNIWIGFGTGVLMYSNAMSAVSKEILEYGQVDGVNDVQEFLHIVLPSIYPTITTFLVVKVAAFFTDQANLYAFFGGYLSFESNTIGYFLFQKVMGDTTRLAEYPYAASAGLSLTVIAVPLTLFSRWALEKFGPRED